MSQSVLIVEDALDLLEMYRVVFRHKPYRVHTAASGEEALQILQRETDIALVFLDLTLPGISGEDLLKKIRQEDRYAGLRVVVMSGWDDLRQRAHAMGADGCVRKPAVLPHLEELVEEALAS